LGRLEARLRVESRTERCTRLGRIPFDEVRLTDHHVAVRREFRRPVDQEPQFADSGIDSAELNPCRCPVVPCTDQRRVELQRPIELFYRLVELAGLHQYTAEVNIRVRPGRIQFDTPGVCGEGFVPAGQPRVCVRKIVVTFGRQGIELDGAFMFQNRLRVPRGPVA